MPMDVSCYGLVHGRLHLLVFRDRRFESPFTKDAREGVTKVIC